MKQILKAEKRKKKKIPNRNEAKERERKKNVTIINRFKLHNEMGIKRRVQSARM